MHKENEILPALYLKFQVKIKHTANMSLARHHPEFSLLVVLGLAEQN